MRLKQAYPHLAARFSWYADEAHYTADYPQDHTPFSMTGWPYVSPYPYVFATDVMDGDGVDCAKLFAYWLAEAKAGRMPWLKYLIWQAKLYDVRNGWRPQDSSGHMEHIHLSVRTDYRDASLGEWSLLPKEDDMDASQDQMLKATNARTGALALGQASIKTSWTKNPNGDEPQWSVRKINEIVTTQAELKATLAVIQSALARIERAIEKGSPAEPGTGPALPWTVTFTGTGTIDGE